MLNSCSVFENLSEGKSEDLNVAGLNAGGLENESYMYENESSNSRSSSRIYQDLTAF